MKVSLEGLIMFCAVFYLLIYIALAILPESRASLCMLGGMRSEEDQIKVTPPLPPGDSNEGAYKRLKLLIAGP